MSTISHPAMRRFKRTKARSPRRSQSTCAHRPSVSDDLRRFALERSSLKKPRLSRTTSYIGPAGEATIAQAHRVARAEPAHVQGRSISPGGRITEATIAQAKHIARVPVSAPVRVFCALETAGVPADNVMASKISTISTLELAISSLFSCLNSTASSDSSSPHGALHSPA
ncbi:hypothetical protein C8R44DRAFT_752167 [Mycena epipterygia]|nr:hypothetical protein C8R44DRAFT_752167 [Mycena epipterygia]